MALNCWEFKKCGREPGGANVAHLGVCPAATAEEADGFCDGKNGGRGCAFITGTFCGGTIQGTAADKEKNCAGCEFYKTLKHDHGMQQSVFRFGEYVRARA